MKKGEFLKLSRDLTLITWSKGHKALRVGFFQGESTPCLDWCPRVLFKRKYAFTLSRDFIRPPHWGVIGIHGWELLAVYYHPDKFGDHRYWNSGDIMVLICHVTSRDHMFIGGSLSRQFASLPCLVTFDLVQVQI